MTSLYIIIMGSAQSNPQVISTVWLGVNDNWEDKVRSKLTFQNGRWAGQVQRTLEFSQRAQEVFLKEIQRILDSDANLNQAQSMQFLLANDYLLRHYEQREASSNDLTQSSLNLDGVQNSQVLILNHSLSQSSTQIYDLAQNVQDKLAVSQQLTYLQVMEYLQAVIASQDYPFERMIAEFSKAMVYDLSQFLSSRSPGQLQKIRQKVQSIASEINTFVAFLIDALNDYLTESVDFKDNKHLKEGLNYQLFFLRQIFNAQSTTLLIELLKLQDNNLIENMRSKLYYFRQQGLGRLELFQIPAKSISNKDFLNLAVQSLKELQFAATPSEKFAFLLKMDCFIRKAIRSRNIPSQVQLQLTNFVIVNAQVVSIQSEYHLLSLFFPQSQQLQRFANSLEFIQNIVIA